MESKINAEDFGIKNHNQSFKEFQNKVFDCIWLIEKEIEYF